MEAFSLAVRRRIIELFQSGLEGDDVAEIMACSPAAARRIWQRYREDGLVGPRPHAGGHTPRLDGQQKKQVLAELMAQKPDAFCRELADELHARTGVRVCRQTIGSWLAELGFTRKKSRCTPPSNSGRTSRRNGRPGSTPSPPSATATSPAWPSSTRAAR
jgi:transposase